MLRPSELITLNPNERLERIVAAKVNVNALSSWLSKAGLTLQQLLHRQVAGNSVPEAIFLLRGGSRGTCCTCGKPTTFLSLTNGYSRFCSVRCAKGNPELKNEFKRTIKARTPEARELINLKRKQTVLAQYGVESVAQDPTVRAKIAATRLVKNSAAAATKKARQTNLARRGVEHHMHDEVVADKVRRALLKNGLDVMLSRAELAGFQLNSPKYFGNKKSYYPWTCTSCGNQFVDNCWNGSIPRCLTCQPRKAAFIGKESQLEANLATALAERVKVTRHARIFGDRREVDLYFPGHQLAIEVDGTYWHSERNGFDKWRHLARVEEAAKHGVQLLRFYDCEILDKFDIVKSIVLAKLGNFKRRVFARKLKIKALTVQEARNFLEQNHLAGYAGASVRLGLADETGNLLMVMTFARHRFGKDKTSWEIVRFAAQAEIQVVGGGSKLLTTFIREQRPRKIITYADARYGNGAAYKLMGFTRVGKTPPGFYYVHPKTKRLINRLTLSKARQAKCFVQFDEGLSERENAAQNGFWRIWDVGHYVFELDLNPGGTSCRSF